MHNCNIQMVKIVEYCAADRWQSISCQRYDAKIAITMSALCIVFLRIFVRWTVAALLIWLKVWNLPVSTKIIFVWICVLILLLFTIGSVKLHIFFLGSSEIFWFFFSICLALNHFEHVPLKFIRCIFCCIRSRCMFHVAFYLFFVSL